MSYMRVAYQGAHKPLVGTSLFLSASYHRTRRFTILKQKILRKLSAKRLKISLSNFKLNKIKSRAIRKPPFDKGGSTPAAGSPFSKKHNSAGLYWLCAVVGNKAKITPFFPRSAFSAQQGCRPAALPAWGRRGPPAQRGRLPRACPSPSVCSWL